MTTETMTAADTDLYLPQAATLVSKTAVTAMEMLFEIRLDSGQGINHMPGQFVEVTIPGVGEAPISVSSAPNGQTGFELVVRRAGRVTTAMHELRPGERLGIRGPFGSHFPVDTVMKGRDVVFIAGGCGLAPLRSAIGYVLNHRQDYGNVTILYGCKAPVERMLVGELQNWSERHDVNFMETVDRAGPDWKGNLGVITNLIPKAGIDASRAVVAACGPPIMYKFVVVSLYAVQVTDQNIFVSLERRMKCGIGKCGHCQVNGLYACVDGPVFNYANVVRVREAV